MLEGEIRPTTCHANMTKQILLHTTELGKPMSTDLYSSEERTRDERASPERAMIRPG